MRKVIFAFITFCALLVALPPSTAAVDTDVGTALYENVSANEATSILIEQSAPVQVVYHTMATAIITGDGEVPVDPVSCNSSKKETDILLYSPNYFSYLCTNYANDDDLPNKLVHSSSGGLPYLCGSDCA